MTQILSAIILLIISLTAVVLRKTYAVVPAKEMKRQARQGDSLAKVFYRAVAYDGQLTVLLWLLILLPAAAAVILLAGMLPFALAILAVAAVLAYLFVWEPGADVGNVGVRVTVWLTPPVVWLVSHLLPVLRWIHDKIRRYRTTSEATGMFETEDVVALFKRQQNQPDNRILPETLDLAVHALTFAHKKVASIVTPKKEVKLVNVDDALGPIVMDELNKSGHSRFPVYEGKKDNIVGTLFLRDMVGAKQGGKVRDITNFEVYYLHEDHSLEQALDAFLKTKRHLFIVLNNFEEFVGIITIEDVLEQLVGRQITDEFDSYESRQAVAAHLQPKKHEPEVAPATAKPEPKETSVHQQKPEKPAA